MRKLILTACLLLAAVVFTACEKRHNEQNLNEIIVGRYWSGDLGFTDKFGALGSCVYFNGNGFGYDELYDPQTGKPTGDRLDLQWWAYDTGTIIIDYGRQASPRELRNVYYTYLTLTGDLFIDGDYHGRVRLTME